MRYRLDRSVRRLRDDRILIGGSPQRLFRLTDAGAELLRSIAAKADVRSTKGVDALVRRLVDAGLVHPEPPRGSGPFTESDVTVVVPVRDRRDALDRLLTSLAEASPSAPVIVVDDGSVEPVADRAGVEVVVRHPRARGPAAARNTGAQRSRTPLVAFVDSDCVVGRGWLGPLIAQFCDPSTVAVAPRVRAAPSVGTPTRSGGRVGRWTRLLAAYDGVASPLDMGPNGALVAPGTRLSYVPSAALVIRADAFVRHGGFDESMQVGEDVDLVWRVRADGSRVRYEPGSVVRHEVRPTVGAWVRQRFGYGTSAAALDQRHPGSVAPAVVSPWSLAVWGLVLWGHPVSATALAAGTVAAMARQLPDVPLTETARLVLGGHLATARQLAAATIRVWWPAAVCAALLSRRSRRVLSIAAATTVTGALLDRARSEAGSGDGATVARVPDPLRFSVLAVLDDVAYGAGVWVGCVRARSSRVLMPRITRR